ncbi:mandelate racemase/muconate lactonizing enzyme family protein [Halomicrococcus gelatinilyticus]|uniref:mandelate racemase/muconate lactonizing enzyme family protein n=1 Tax=Halomicrococcus gelatinilyticus TaxID=1702103 RepID=UPI002E15E0F3
MTVETREFSLPLASPLDTALGAIEHREGLLVRVEDDGDVGIGEATPLPGWTESPSRCRDALADVDDVLADPDGVLSELDDRPAARHGVALALADLRARRDGVPLYRHLVDESGRVDGIPVNATVGDAPSDETVAAAEDAVAAGFDAVKVKVGARPVDEDVARLRDVRAAVGPEVELRADANGAWSREQAEEAFAALADVGVVYVEQPLPADDLDGLADLRGGPVGVAADESLAARSVDAVLDAGAADVLVLKPMALGGPDRTVAAARQARERGVEAVVTTTVDAVVARTAAIHAAAAIPDRPACGLATAELLDRDLGPDRARVVDGRIGVPQTPGVGVADTWGSP